MQPFHDEKAEVHSAWGRRKAASVLMHATTDVRAGMKQECCYVHTVLHCSMVKQVLNHAGTGDDEQMIDALHGTYKSTSCCTITSSVFRGEVGRVGSPGRREIGHGKRDGVR